MRRSASLAPLRVAQRRFLLRRCGKRGELLEGAARSARSASEACRASFGLAKLLLSYAQARRGGGRGLSWDAKGKHQGMLLSQERAGPQRWPGQRPPAPAQQAGAQGQAQGLSQAAKDALARALGMPAAPQA